MTTRRHSTKVCEKARLGTAKRLTSYLEIMRIFRVVRGRTHQTSPLRRTYSVSCWRGAVAHQVAITYAHASCIPIIITRRKIRAKECIVYKRCNLENQPGDSINSYGCVFTATFCFQKHTHISKLISVVKYCCILLRGLFERLRVEFAVNCILCCCCFLEGGGGANVLYTAFLNTS